MMVSHCASGIFNCLPNDKFLDCTKFKTFADNNSNVAQMVISVFDRVENIMGKGENAGFSKSLFLRVVKSRNCVVKS